MTFAQEVTIVDDLQLRNRAYQLLYALGEKPEQVETLEPGEASYWVHLAQEVLEGDRSTELRRKIAEVCNPPMLHYIATGRMRAVKFIRGLL